MRRITFFFPSMTVGGAELLFVRLASHLARLGHTVWVVDFPQGVLARELANTPVQIIPFTEGQPFDIPQDSCLILTAMTLHSFMKVNIDPASKILIYCMHQYSLVVRFFVKTFSAYDAPIETLRETAQQKYPQRYQDIRDCLAFIWSRQGMVFMDEHNFQVNQQFFNLASQDPNPFICPVPCPETGLPSLLGLPRSPRPECIEIGIVGRLVPEKIHSVHFVIQHLAKYLQQNPSLQGRIHLIGDGMSRRVLQKVELPPNLQLVFMGTLRNQEIDFYLKRHVDVVFAMGTSLLDGAKLKIPTVVTDSSFVPIDLEEKFSWYFELPPFALGGSVGKTGVLHQHTFEDLMTAIYQNGLGPTYGERCYQKFLKEQTLEVSGNRLLSQIEQCSLTAEDFLAHNYFLVT